MRERHPVPQERPKIIGMTPPDKAAMMAVLLSLGLWDAMTTDEREAACERGEVWDTLPGRALMAVVRRHQ